jgi:hypothetical protein
MSLNNGCDFILKNASFSGLWTPFVAQDADQIMKHGGVFGPGPRRRFFEYEGAYQELRAEVLTGVDPFDHGISPCSEAVDPAFYRVIVFPNFGGKKIAAPVVNAHRLHQGAPPNVLPFVSIKNFPSD